MLHFKSKMLQIWFPASVRPSVRSFVSNSIRPSVRPSLRWRLTLILRWRRHWWKGGGAFFHQCPELLHQLHLMRCHFSCGVTKAPGLIFVWRLLNLFQNVMRFGRKFSFRRAGTIFQQGRSRWKIEFYHVTSNFRQVVIAISLTPVRHRRHMQFLTQLLI